MSLSSLSAVRDTARLAALQGTTLLDSPVEEAFDRLTRLATRLLHVPVALVSLVDQDRQFFKSCIGLPEPWASTRETPLSHSFCQHAVISGRPLIIPDARDHPLVRDNPAVSDLNVVAYAGIPLITAGGHALGSFCVIDSRPRQWTDEEVEILEELATSVMTEIELRRQTKEAREALQARDELLSIVAHDLKNPVAVIYAFAGLLQHRIQLQRPSDAGELKLGLEQMQVAAHQLTLQIDELLDVARMQAGYALELHVQPADVAALAQEIVAEQQQTTHRHVIRLTANASELVGPYDPGRIRRVLTNLINNAIKYSPHGGEVDVSVTRETDGDSAQAVVEVRDRGVGIPKDDLEHIFERFRRGGNVLGKIAGTGIGLASAQQIVAQHGGTIQVTSVEGEGATFKVRLPLPDTAVGRASTDGG